MFLSSFLYITIHQPRGIDYSWDVRLVERINFLQYSRRRNAIKKSIACDMRNIRMLSITEVFKEKLSSSLALY